MRYFLDLSYVGEAYSGWQIQQNALTVQEVVQKVLGNLLAENIKVVGSGRTDKGVHAKQQVAHFDTLKPIDDVVHLKYKLNRLLPPDIGVSAIYPVVQDAHARFDAAYRIYEYGITTHKDPFYRNGVLWMHTLPPLEQLNRVAALFCVKADFEFFSKAVSPTKTAICTVASAYWFRLDSLTIFRIKANRFLYGMVRLIVSAILKVGRGKMDVDNLNQLILKKSMLRPVLNLVPAHGLTLVEVAYPEALFL